MKNYLCSIGIVIALTCGQAFAQCATGVDTGGGGCIPPDAPGMPGYQNGARRIAPVWEDHWGAIAIDLSTLQAGTMEGKPSKSEAEKLAMASCMNEGSKHCKVVMTFFNQCASLAVGDLISYSKAPTKDKAEKSAIANCGSIKTCRIVYSACSYPVRIR